MNEFSSGFSTRFSSGARIAVTPKSLLPLLLLLLLPFAVLADTISDLDSFFTRLYPANEPGSTIAIVRDGEVIYSKAFGMADLENGIANQRDMVFRLGSITKQFTTVAIMMLEQEGKLKVTDDILLHLPDYTPPSSTITIEHLMTHTSGIPNYTAIPGWMDIKIRENLSVEEMMAGWQDLPLEFEPGSKWNYSNSGYFMLGAIIESASGIPYDEFIEERIFKKLGMNSSYYDHSERIIPNRARGYDKGPDGGFINASFLDMGQPYAAGSLASTIEDMARWDAALYTDAILPQEALERMWTSYKLTDGSDSGYGYGWAIGEHNGHKVVSHGGGIPGFRTQGYRLPDQKLYVSVLSNGAAVSPDIPGQAAVKAMLEEPYEVIPVELDPAQLERFTGVYRDEDDTARNIRLEDGKLTFELAPGFKMSLIPLSSHRFGSNQSANQIEFSEENGSVTQLEMVGLTSRMLKSRKTDEPLPE
jgi:CubicO group peptidase (beta-lactamase class C family)